MGYEGQIVHEQTTASTRIASASHALAFTAGAGPRGRQPWSRLLKAVADLAGGQAELVSHVEHEWTSATFSGSRHAITVRFPGAEAAEAGEAFIVALPDHEFSIPRYLVADAQVVAVDASTLPERNLVAQVELWLLERA